MGKDDDRLEFGTTEGSDASAGLGSTDSADAHCRDTAAPQDSGRRYSARSRPRDRIRGELHARFRKPVAIDEAVGQVVINRGLTDDVLLHCVHIYWPEIVGAKWAAQTAPDTIADGVLRVGVRTSAWMHELRFHKKAIVDRINSWIDARKTMLGGPPFVSDLRYVLERPRTPVADPAHAQCLFQRHLRRLRPKVAIVPPVGSASERAAILAETCVVEDPEVRRAIEELRVKWNR